MGQWVFIGVTFLSVAMAGHEDPEKKTSDFKGGQRYAYETRTEPQEWNALLKEYVMNLRAEKEPELLKRFVAEPKFQAFAKAFGEKLEKEGIGAFDGLIWNNLGAGLSISHHEVSLMVGDLWLESLSPEQRAKIVMPPRYYEASDEENWKANVGWVIRMMSRRPPYPFQDFWSNVRAIALTSGPLDMAMVDSDPFFMLFRKGMADRGEVAKVDEMKNKYVYWRNTGAAYMKTSEYYSSFTAGQGLEEDDRDMEWRLMRARGAKNLPDYTPFVKYGQWRPKPVEEKVAAREVSKPAPVFEPKLTTQTIYDQSIPTSLLVQNQSFNVRSSDGNVHRWTFVGYNAHGPMWSYGGQFTAAPSPVYYYPPVQQYRIVKPVCAGFYYCN